MPAPYAMPFDIQNLLHDWGVTFTSLAVVGSIFFLLLMLSAREFVGWFAKTGKILKMDKQILGRLELLESQTQKQTKLLESHFENMQKILNKTTTAEADRQFQAEPPLNSPLMQKAQPIQTFHRFPLGPPGAEKPATPASPPSFTLN